VTYEPLNPLAARRFLFRASRNKSAKRGSTQGKPTPKFVRGGKISTTDKQTPAFTSPLNVFWRWFAPLYTRFRSEV